LSGAFRAHQTSQKAPSDIPLGLSLSVVSGVSSAERRRELLNQVNLQEEEQHAPPSGRGAAFTSFRRRSSIHLLQEEEQHAPP